MRTVRETRIACARINRLLEEEAIRLKLGTKRSLARLEKAHQIDIKTFHNWAVLEFQEYVRRRLVGHDFATASALISEGARLLGITTVSGRRYLDKLSGGRHAPFTRHGDMVLLNPEYISSEQDPYWKDEEEVENEVEE